ncbi:MAG: QWxxN domain [Enterococcus sp.]
MPGKNHREVIGLYNNILNDKNGSKNAQKTLNFIAKHSGQQLSSEGIRTPVGLFYTSLLLSTLVPVRDRPNQQTAVKQTTAAFEANTYIVVRHEDNQTNIRSFASHSIVNRTRITPPFPENTTQVMLHQQTFTQLFFNLVDATHDWSLHIHKEAHQLAELLECHTTTRADLEKKWGLWEKYDSKDPSGKYHVQTICQKAIAKAQQKNNQLPEQGSGNQHFSFERKPNMPDQGASYFFAGDSVQKLRATFQTYLEKRKNQSIYDIKGMPTNLHNQLIEIFWGGLADLFAHFLNQHEHTSYTQEPVGRSSGSVIHYFLELLSRSFSGDYGEQVSASLEREKNLTDLVNTLPVNYSMSTNNSKKKPKNQKWKNQERNKQKRNKQKRKLRETTGKNVPVLNVEEVSFFTQLWQLAEDFSKTMDQYIKHLDVLQFLGAEASPISEEKIAKISIDTISKAKINRIVSAYLNNQTLLLSTSESLSPVWDDADIFQKRGETDTVNQNIKSFLCEQKILCNDSSNLEIILSAQKWVDEGGTNAEDRRNQIARMILKSSGLAEENLSDTRGKDIFQQWKNNNALMGFTFEEEMQASLNEPQIYAETTKVISQANVNQTSTSDSELEQVNKIVGSIITSAIPPTRFQEPLPIFYYDYELFQKRNKTSSVNKKMKDFFLNEGVEIHNISVNELVGAYQKWVRKEKFDQTAKEQFWMYFILKAYGIENLRLGEFISPTRLQRIFMQWKVNTLLEDYVYKEVTEGTLPYKLSQLETSLITQYQNQKKESDQIYVDFINDRPPTIDKSQPIIAVYYNELLFKERDKTSAVNEAVRKLLIKQDVTFRNLSASELVRGMQGWILEGKTYATISEREKKVAKLLQKEYGIIVKEVTEEEARQLLLQWENNNAQAGYTYKEISIAEIDKVQAGGNKKNHEINQKIRTFLSKNADDPIKQVASEPKKTPLTKLSKKQKSQLRKSVIDFLIERGVELKGDSPNELIQTITHWVLLEKETQKTLDFTKVKPLAKRLLGLKEDVVISEKEAESTLLKWMNSIAENDNSSLSTPKPYEDSQQEVTSTQIPVTTENPQKTTNATYDTGQWRNPNVMKQVKHFFINKGLLSKDPKKEQIMVAVGKWFTQEGSGMVFTNEKLQPLAKVILYELNLYGGKVGENISVNDAKSTVMKWVIENVLGSSVETYMLQKILESPENPSQFTIGHLRNLFEVDELKKTGFVSFHPLSVSLQQEKNLEKEEIIFKKLWVACVNQVLPNYFLETSALADELLVSDYGSLMQLMGATFLKSSGHLTHFNQTEIRILGAFFLEKVMEAGANTLEEWRILLIPALLATVQLEPNLLREALKNGNHQEVILQTFIGYWQRGYFKLMENQEIINNLFKKYQEAMLEWRRKKALAEEVANICLERGFPYTKYMLEQVYLGGREPCPEQWTPPNLEEWYTRLTKAVSESYFLFDKKLIEFALRSIDQQEIDFIFSEETHLYEGKAELKNEIHYTGGAPGTGGMLLINVKGRVTWWDTTLNLDKTDLFVAIQGDKERWYALKRLDKEGGYVIYRVDKDPLLYLKYGLLDHQDIWIHGYKKEGDMIRIGKNLYTFTNRVNRDKELSHGTEMQGLIETLSRTHSDHLYQQLYESGNDKTRNEQIWDVIKHFIPFYDCVTGIINQDVAEAVPSCIIDAILLIPVLGQITVLNTKFALGMARAIIQGGIKNAIQKSAHFVPKMAEIRKVLINIVRYFDPGVELVIDGGRLVTKALLKWQNQARVSSEIKLLLERLEALEKNRAPVSQKIVMAHLPGNGLEVPVRRVKDHLYMQVTNLETEDVFGKLYMLKGKQLETFKGPVTFRADQIALLHRLKVKLDEKQVFVIVENMNSKAYGEGPILTVAKEGEETQHFITMNGELIPVKITPIKEHGVRFDVYDGEKIFSVNYNGVEWYFEAPTSPFVSKELEKQIAGMLDQFETLKNPSGLSAPDEKGLLWNELGRSYIKIVDHYIPLILLNKERNRYHLVKKNFNEAMTILKFDPEMTQFRMETALEKQQMMREIEEEGEILFYGGKSDTKKKSSSSSSLGEIPSTSHGGPLQISGTGVVTDYNKLPPSAGKGEEWTKHRNAIVYEEVAERTENPNVVLPPLSEFISIPTPAYLVNDAPIREGIIKRIKEYYDINFRVFTGLQSNTVPPFLKPFIEELSEEFRTAQDYFDRAILKCNITLCQATISETRLGEYLTKMFNLEEVVNKEEILRESLERLLAIAEKGEKFLQQTRDWGFENIWVVSSDLVQQGDSQVYYTSLNKFIPQAFAMRYDSECRMMILADSFHFNPDFDPAIELKTPIEEVVMHETTHLTSKTVDLMRYSFPSKGFRFSGKSILSSIHENFQAVVESEGFERFVAQLAKELNLPNLSKEAVARAIDVDPMLKVNFLLTDAEVVTIILRDFVEGRSYDDLVPTRVTRNTDKLGLGKGFMIQLLALDHIYNYQLLKKDLELIKSQEQVEVTSESAISSSITGNSTSSEIKQTTTRMKSFLNLKVTSIEESNIRNKTTLSQRSGKKKKELQSQL